MIGIGNPASLSGITQEDDMDAPDPVDHPPHYNSHPSGVETITITEHMGFCLGNVIKYVMRAPYKGAMMEDLKKARWYLDREIARLQKCQHG